MTAEGETLQGDLIADSVSSLRATLKNGTTLSGALRHVALMIEDTSQWHVTADSDLTVLTCPGGLAGLAQLRGDGHTVRYDAQLPANRWLEGKSYPLTGGGSLSPHQGIAEVASARRSIASGGADARR